MIEINLLPGAPKKRKKRAGGGFSFKLPENLPTLDRMLAFIVGAWIIGPGVIGWLYLGVHGDIAGTQAEVDVAVADSTRLSAQIAALNALEARQDTIQAKLAIIEEIDAGRFVWSHVLDEVSLALPPYTWLTSIFQTDGGPRPGFTIQGRTGSLPALPMFLEALERSPFIRGVEILSTAQAQIEDDKIVNNFVIQAGYEEPPAEAIQTVPLFAAEMADSAATGAAEAAPGDG